MRTHQHRGSAQETDWLSNEVLALGEETFKLIQPVASAVRMLSKKYPTVIFTAFIATLRMAALLTWKRVGVGTTQYSVDGLIVRPEPSIDGGCLRVVTESEDEGEARIARRELFAAMGWPAQN